MIFVTTINKSVTIRKNILKEYLLRFQNAHNKINSFHFLGFDKNLQLIHSEYLVCFHFNITENQGLKQFKLSPRFILHWQEVK